MSVHTSTLFFAIILTLSYSEAKGLKNDTIYCNDVKTPLDFQSVLGTWYMVGSIESTHGPNKNNTDAYYCFSMELIGVLKENSRDLLLKSKAVETMLFKDVEGKGGMKKTRGCYQQVKNWNDKILGVQSSQDDDIDIMMMQFYLMETSERFLVQYVWHTAIPARIALIYSKNQDFDVAEEDLEPIKEFVTKLRGEEQELEFCIEDRHDNDILYDLKSEQI